MRKRPKYIHVSLDEKTAERLKIIAKAQGRTVTELLREAIAKIIMEYADYLKMGKEKTE